MLGIYESGSGNVAVYTSKKIQELGGTVVACSTSNGVALGRGIDGELVWRLKEIRVTRRNTSAAGRRAHRSA